MQGPQARSQLPGIQRGLGCPALQGGNVCGMLYVIRVPVLHCTELECDRCVTHGAGLLLGTFSLE